MELGVGATAVHLGVQMVDGHGGAPELVWLLWAPVWFRMALWATSTDNVDGLPIWSLAMATWGSRGHAVQHGG